MLELLRKVTELLGRKSISGLGDGDLNMIDSLTVLTGQSALKQGELWPDYF